MKFQKEITAVSKYVHPATLLRLMASYFKHIFATFLEDDFTLKPYNNEKKIGLRKFHKTRMLQTP